MKKFLAAACIVLVLTGMSFAATTGVVGATKAPTSGVIPFPPPPPPVQK